MADRVFKKVRRGDIVELVTYTQTGKADPYIQGERPNLEQWEWTIVREMILEAEDIAKDNDFPSHTVTGKVFGTTIKAIWSAR